jgi:hypothetical protein
MGVPYFVSWIKAANGKNDSCINEVEFQMAGPS